MLFINNFDILINSLLDYFYQLNLNKQNSLDDLNYINKYLDDKLNEYKKLKNYKLIFENVKMILNCYIINIILNENNINQVKDKLIKNKFDSINLANILNINKYINILDYIINENDKDLLEKLYKTNIDYKNIINILNNFGYQNIISDFKIKNNKLKLHNILKLLIFNLFYRKFYRKDCYYLINNDDSKLKEIEVIIPKIKVLDIINIQNILNAKEIENNLNFKIIEFYNEYEKHKLPYQDKIKLDKLFESNYIIPIVDDFLRYHKISEKYEKKLDIDKDNRKIKYIMSKIEKVKDLYSYKTKNNKDLLRDTYNLFFKPFMDRKIVIYNEIEELFIINKLLNQGKKAIESNEWFHDLLNIRKYSYVNFNNINNEGIVYEPNKTLLALRYSNIENYNPNNNLEFRTIAKNNKYNVVGILIKNNYENLFDKTIKDIENVNKNNKNGILETTNIIKNKIINDDKKNYYWIFNNKNDTIDKETFENININILNNLYYLYDNINNFFKDFIINKLNDNYKKLNNSFYHSYLLLNKYTNHINFKKLSPNYNTVLNKIYDISPISENIKMKNILFGINGNVIKLPEYIKKKDKFEIINLNKNVKNKTIKNYQNKICQHLIDWKYINNNKKNNTKYNDLIYKFVKKYIISNEDNIFICKSCNQLVEIENNIVNNYDGTVGINLSINLLFYESNEYLKYSIAIKNIEKLIEKIAHIFNFNSYIGNVQINKIKRTEILKNIIDLIILNEKNIGKKNKREREINSFNKYGIISEYSNFFIFTLGNEIFQYSSKDVDKFKKIKINNIITYIILFFILEIKEYDLDNFVFDKQFNKVIYKNFGINLFNNIKVIKNNKNETVNIQNYDGLCYLIFYISCNLSKYNIWFIDNDEINKNKLFILKQKIIINTFFDLLNSILNINNLNNNIHIYDNIFNKFIVKLNNLFIEYKINKNIKNNENNFINNENKDKIKSIKLNSIKEEIIFNEIYNKLTNTYYLKNKEYYNSNFKNSNEYKIFIDKIKNNHEIKMLKNFNKNGIKYITPLSDVKLKKIEYNYEYLKKILEKKHNNFNILKKKITYLGNTKKLLDYNKNYFNELFDIIKENINENIFIDNYSYNINNSYILINFDYLGNKIDKPIYIDINSKKINIKYNNYINEKVYEIYNSLNDNTLIFSYYKHYYLGYFKDTRFNNLSNLSLSLKYISSIKSNFILLGFDKYYYFINKSNYIITNNNIFNNLKNILIRIKTLIFNLKLKYNKDNKILSKYISRIENINIEEDNKIFLNEIDNFNINEIDNIKEIDKEVDYFKLYNESLNINKLSNYFISEILFLIKINKNKYQRINLINFIIELIIDFNNKNLNKENSFDLLKYKTIIIENITESKILSNDIIFDEKEISDEELQDFNEMYDSIDIDQFEDEEDSEINDPVLFQNND